MNIRGMANQAIQVVNPNIPAIWLQANGYTTNSAGIQTPVQISNSILVQVQGVDGTDLKHIDALNIQGVFRSVVMYGNPQGAVRIDARGGDILQFPETPSATVQNWKVIRVNETWDIWARVLVTLQVS